MKTQVKICGLMRPEDIACAIEAGADYLGFIVECPSKRRLSVAQAASLAPIDLPIPSVAVTVNPNDQLIDHILEHMRPDFIQLHGDETPERAAEIARRVKIIKAVGISSDEDMKASEAYAGIAEFLLYDAKPPKGETIRGGHGQAIDWTIIARAPTPKRFAVAGGLNPDNIGQAITVTNAPIVDVSSGLEDIAGVKDHSKIRTFMDVVKNGQSILPG